MNDSGIKEYIFFIYRGDNLIWQFCVKTNSPKTIEDNLLRRYNIQNGLFGQDKATLIRHCTLDTWIDCLQERGKHYV